MIKIMCNNYVKKKKKCFHPAISQEPCGLPVAYSYPVVKTFSVGGS